MRMRECMFLHVFRHYKICFEADIAAQRGSCLSGLFQDLLTAIWASFDQKKINGYDILLIGLGGLSDTYKKSLQRE